MTANQKYKQSKSDLSFRDWLKSEQESGILVNHEMFNYDGIQDISDGVQDISVKENKTKDKSMMGLNLLGIVALVSLIYGKNAMNK